MEKVHLSMVTSNAYIQKPGLLKYAGEWISKYGKSIFIVTGHKSWASAGEQLTASLRQSGIQNVLEKYQGECSYEEVERLQERVVPGTDLIVGVGGGKVLDTAKALSDALSIPLITIPTLAATCAAVTNLSIMYTVDGVYIGFPIFYRNAVLTLVDTDVIAAAPLPYLIAGIGDTLAKWVESSASSSGKKHNLPTTAGLQMAKLCYDTLIHYSEASIEEVKQGKSGEALQKVIDAIILISGAVGGFGEENCRSAAAHAVHNGLTYIPETHHAQHGSKVAYGILVQFVLEKRSKEEIAELLSFYRKTGLPSSLAELGINRSLLDNELQEVARISLLPESTMGMMPFPVSPEMVIDAIRTVEQFNQ